VEADSHEPPVAGEAERERALRLLSGDADERRHVRVAADHTVEHDDVGGRSELAIGRDVAVAPLDAPLEPGLLEQRAAFLLVRSRELDVRRMLGAGAQQLELDLADPPPISSTVSPRRTPTKSTIRRATASSPRRR
jgi:hypothetical protein